MTDHGTITLDKHRLCPLSRRPRSVEETSAPMTDREVIAAIRAHHLKANIGWIEDRGDVPTHPSTGVRIMLHWRLAHVDPGGTVWGPGPYVKLPITGYWGNRERTVHRVYPPARLRRRLAARWHRETPNA